MAGQAQYVAIYTQRCDCLYDYFHYELNIALIVNQSNIFMMITIKWHDTLLT